MYSTSHNLKQHREGHVSGSLPAVCSQGLSSQSMIWGWTALTEAPVQGAWFSHEAQQCRCGSAFLLHGNGMPTPLNPQTLEHGFQSESTALEGSAWEHGDIIAHFIHAYCISVKYSSRRTTNKNGGLLSCASMWCTFICWCCLCYIYVG